MFHWAMFTPKQTVFGATSNRVTPWCRATKPIPRLCFHSICISLLMFCRPSEKLRTGAARCFRQGTYSADLAVNRQADEPLQALKDFQTAFDGTDFFKSAFRFLPVFSCPMPLDAWRRTRTIRSFSSRKRFSFFPKNRFSESSPASCMNDGGDFAIGCFIIHGGFEV